MRSNLYAILMIFMFSWQSPAYLVLAESAETLEKNEIHFGLYPQVFLNEGGGMNFGGFSDFGLSDSVSLRGFVEFGKIDFVLGGSVKWTPFPDIDNQPAIGFRGGLTHARDENENSLATQFAFLLSKKYPSDTMVLNPYIGLPLTFLRTKDETKTGTQFVIGSEFFESDDSIYKFGGEFGFSLKDSYSYFLGFWTFQFQ